MTQDNPAPSPQERGATGPDEEPVDEPYWDADDLPSTADPGVVIDPEEPDEDE